MLGGLVRLLAVERERMSTACVQLGQGIHRPQGARFAYLSKPDCAVGSLAEQMAAVRGYFFQRFTDEASALR